jgi:glycosyltransferase involved in cell wall biosynthesis
MAKLRIGIFTHDFYPYVGGQGRHIYELYKQSEAQRLDNMEFIFFSPALNSIPNHVQLFPETNASKFKNISFSIKLHFSIKKLINQYRLDIVHCHGGPGGIFMTARIDKPLFFTCHHTYWQQSHYIKKQAWKRIFIGAEKRGYQNAQSIICVSPSTQRILIENYGLAAAKIHMIPNGFSSTSSLKSVTINGKSQSILFVGRLDERKGIDFLVHGMQLLGKTHPQIKLEVIGSGKLLAPLRQYADSRQLNVVFHGFVEDSVLEKIYSRFFVQIAPSIFEGFGITILEAMNHSLPIIGTDVDGINDIIQNGQNGLLIPYGDKTELINAVLRLYQKPEMQNRLAKAGLASLRDYQWSTIFDQTTRLYETTI